MCGRCMLTLEIEPMRKDKERGRTKKRLGRDEEESKEEGAGVIEREVTRAGEGERAESESVCVCACVSGVSEEIPFARASSKSSWVTWILRSRSAYMPASVHTALISAPDAPVI